MKNKIQIISQIKFIKAAKFFDLSGLNQYKLKQIKSEQSKKEELILITAPDGNLFVNLESYQSWCTSNQPDVSIEFIRTDLAIITAELYTELSGYTIKAIKRKVEDKIWCAPIAFRAPDGELLININSVEKWIISQYLKEVK